MDCETCSKNGEDCQMCFNGRNYEVRQDTLGSEQEIAELRKALDNFRERYSEHGCPYTEHQFCPCEQEIKDNSEEGDVDLLNNCLHVDCAWREFDKLRSFYLAQNEMGY